MEEQCIKCNEWFKDDDIYLHIPHTDVYYCKKCYFSDQPERLSEKDHSSTIVESVHEWVDDMRQSEPDNERSGLRQK